MNADRLDELARDPRFIPGIYNYCDRWCERCPLSNRCLNYAMELEEDGGDPAARDASNEVFWQKLHQTFHDTLAMIQAEAKKRGIDLDAPSLRAEVAAQERAERRLAAKNSPLARAALAYAKDVDRWLDAAKPVLADKIEELKQQVNLAIGEPEAEARRLADFTDVIRWYQHFIYVKLRRAIESQAREELEADPEMRAFPKDSDGSAKVVLIAMDRCISAWAGLHAALGDDADGILDLLAQLTALRRETEKVFPAARAFVRPGFDDGGKAGKPSRRARG